MQFAPDSEARFWKLLLAAMIGAGAGAIPTYSIGLFVAPLSAEFGWTRTQIALAITITASMTMIASPFVGRLVDRFGARRIAIPALCALALGIAGVGLVQSYAWYVTQWIIVGIAGAFSSVVVWTQRIASRFIRNRGFAIAIVLSGIGIVGTATPLVSTWLIETLGWRLAYSGLALYVVAIVLPLTFLFFRDEDRRQPGRKDDSTGVKVRGTGLTLKEALRVREFWVLAGSFLLAASAVMAMVMHFVPLLTDSGLSRLQAAVALSVLSAAAVVGRLCAGWLIDRVFAPRLGVAILLLPVIGCIGLSMGATHGMLPFVYAVAIGLAVGAEFDIACFLSARYFGLKNYASIFGVLYMVFSFGIVIGPVIAGLLYDRTGDYDTALLAMGSSFLAAALLMLLCRRYPDYGESPSH